MFFKRLPEGELNIGPILRVHDSIEYDECTAHALGSIAEWKIGKEVDCSYLYRNSKDGEFGISPVMAINAMLGKGIKLETGEVEKPFTKSKRIWGFNLHDAVRRKMSQNGQPVFIGLDWQPYWGDKENIMYRDKEWYTFLPHAMSVWGQTEIDGIIYLKALDSTGEKSGKNGIWLLPRMITIKFAYQLL